jgi:hypothetical protein
MWSMWNAASDRDYYDRFGAYCDEDEAEICEDCSARWDLGAARDDWCATNRSVPEPVHSLAVKEQEVDSCEEVRNNEVPPWITFRAASQAGRRGSESVSRSIKSTA